MIYLPEKLGLYDMVEFGCGAGFEKLSYLSSIHPDLRMLGVDPALSFTVICQKNLDLIAADAKEVIPLLHGSPEVIMDFFFGGYYNDWGKFIGMFSKYLPRAEYSITERAVNIPKLAFEFMQKGFTISSIKPLGKEDFITPYAEDYKKESDRLKADKFEPAEVPEGISDYSVWNLGNLTVMLPGENSKPEIIDPYAYLKENFKTDFPALKNAPWIEELTEFTPVHFTAKYRINWMRSS